MTLSNPVRSRDLIPGKEYRIKMFDCCIEGEIERARFIQHRLDADEDDLYYADLIFDGLVFTHCGQCEFIEASDGDDSDPV